MLISFAVKSAVVLGLGLVVYVALARASAAARRAVLVAALGAALAIPIVAIVGPAWHVETPAVFAAHESPLEGGSIVAAPATAITVAPIAPSIAPASTIVAGDVLVAIWLAGAALLLARGIASQLRARHLARTGVRVAADAIDVRITDGVDSPAVTGIFRSTVLLPRDAETWSAERMRLVLVHELAHVRRRDGLAQLVADAACALHWFDPLAWLVASRLRVERELAADDTVLASGVRASSYAEELLALGGASTIGALAMAERTTLGTRIVAILSARRARGPLGRRGTALLVAGTIGIGAAIACASPEKPHIATDPTTQRAADDVLAAVEKQWSAEAGVIVVLDAATGEILADAGNVGAISPGSTLKPIVIAAALDGGAITATQKFECSPNPRRYGSDELHDSSPNGTLDAAHVLAVSSNIGTSRIFDALGGDQLATWLARFHFTDAPKHIASNSFAGAQVAMGEAIAATPLQMATAYAALASDGVYHAPGGSKGERLVSSATASAVMAMLETAVADPEATGKRAHVDGIHVAGKTGTAALGDHRTYASFVGIADLPARRLVVLVGIETRRDDASGGAVAAPAFAQLVAKLR